REFHKLFIEQEWSAGAGALLAGKRLNTIVPPDGGQVWNVEWPHVAFHGSSVAPTSFDTDKERFLGRYCPLARPAALSQTRLSSVWLKYQAVSGRIWGRSGYYQPGGAFGFRDQLQDSQVFLPLRPEHTRRQILSHAAHQFVDGTTYHWWQPITEEGSRKPLNDDLLWL